MWLQFRYKTVQSTLFHPFIDEKPIFFFSSTLPFEATQYPFLFIFLCVCVCESVCERKWERQSEEAEGSTPIGHNAGLHSNTRSLSLSLSLTSYMDRNIDVCLYDWELWVCCIVYEVCAKNSERRVYLKDCHKEPLSKAAKGCSGGNILLYLYWLLEAIDWKKGEEENQKTHCSPSVSLSFFFPFFNKNWSFWDD